MKTKSSSGSTHPKKIWIDLDNSPHVPFFAPIIEELERRRYVVLLTARRRFQVCELAELFHLRCKVVGRHYGKNKFLKSAGTCLRALELIPTILREKPGLALSHGSRSQLLCSALLGIPSVTIIDYEFADQELVRRLRFGRDRWLMVPDVIPDEALKVDPAHVLKYPGIKEDVYVPRFRPDPRIREGLGFNGQDLVVTVRPPANEAHYHNPQSDILFQAVMEFLIRQSNTRMILLPRDEKQAVVARARWADAFATGKIVIPDRVVDGLNLMWHSDLVISGGGTMNREAAALGVPVYSIFRGKIGAVDQYLADKGQLILLESAQDIQTKIVLARRNGPAQPQNRNSAALQSIVNQLIAVMGSKSRARHRKGH